MVTHGLWFWLLITLSYGQSFYHRLSKRFIEDARECRTPTQKLQNSFLWVMGRNPPVYFFGTIHVPYTEVWDFIPLNSKQAFYKSENIYFELDLTDSVTLATLARCQILPDGIMLRDVVPRTLFKRLKRHLSYIRKMMSVWITLHQRIAGINPAVLYKGLTRNWHRKRPIWIMLLLNGMTEYDIKGHGVSILDTYLLNEAISRNKQIGSIESVNEQCKPLNSLNNSQVIVALNQTLILHENIRRGKAKLTHSTKDLIYHYNCGNLTDVLFTQDMSRLDHLNDTSLSDSFAMEQTRKIDEYLKKELIYKRNKRMSNRVVQLIKKHPKKRFFFAFGAGHFLGNGSIIDRLQKQGYNITRVHPNSSLKRYGKKRKRKNGRNRNRNRKKNKGRRKRRRWYYKGGKKRSNRGVENPALINSHFYENITMKEDISHLPVTKKNDWTALQSSSRCINISHFLWINILILQLIYTIFEE